MQDTRYKLEDAEDEFMKNRMVSERGQVMVLLVLAIVGLLAFTALAIDGGMVYSDRRTAQNAADAAALAGAGAAAQHLRTYDAADPKNNPVTKKNWNCNHSVISGANGALALAEQAAQSRAGNNDFPINYDTSGDNWVDAQCFNKYIEIHIKITVETHSSLAHLIFKGPMVNSVEAVTIVDPSVPIGFGNSIISLTEECSGNDKGTIFDGNHNTIVKDGGIWSNSCIFANGSSGYVTVTQTGSGDPVGISYRDTYKPNGHITDQIVPEPTQVMTDPITIEINPPPDCSGLSNQGNHTGGGDIYAGRYNSIKLNNNEILTMHSGLYCVSKDFTVNGGQLVGEDVTIYLTGDHSSFSTSGTAYIKLDAPTPGCESKKSGGCSPAIGGLLIYNEEGDISLLGNADSYYEGTVFAPNGEIEIGGETSEMSKIGAQLIGNTVKIHGDTTIDIIYDESVIYQGGPWASLYQ
jgi:hypothetical protein